MCSMEYLGNIIHFSTCSFLSMYIYRWVYKWNTLKIAFMDISQIYLHAHTTFHKLYTWRLTTRRKKEAISGMDRKGFPTLSSSIERIQNNYKSQRHEIYFFQYLDAISWVCLCVMSHTYPGFFVPVRKEKSSIID